MQTATLLENSSFATLSMMSVQIPMPIAHEFMCVLCCLKIGPNCVFLGRKTSIQCFVKTLCHSIACIALCLECLRMNLRFCTIMYISYQLKLHHHVTQKLPSKTAKLSSYPPYTQHTSKAWKEGKHRLVRLG